MVYIPMELHWNTDYKMEYNRMDQDGGWGGLVSVVFCKFMKGEVYLLECRGLGTK